MSAKDVERTGDDLPTQAIEQLLHKPYDNPELVAVLGGFADAIEETVSFGTHVLKWSADAATGKPDDSPLLMLLRHELGLADAVSVLVRNSCIEPSKVLLRGMFETLLSAEYILEKDCQRRGLAVVLLHMHDTLKWLGKADEGTQVGKQFRKTLQGDKLAGAMVIDQIADLQGQVDRLKASMESDKYKEVEAEYQSVVKSGVKNPSWHALFDGPRDIEQLARHLGHSGLYEVLYRSWSGSVHATDIFRGKILPDPDGGSQIVQLRLPKDAEEPTKFAISFLLVLFPLYIKHYTPDHLKDLRAWYKGSIRAFYLGISKENVIHVNPP